MAIVSFTNRDMNRGKVVTPAWYRVRVESVGETPTVTAKGPSTNYNVEGTILYNGDTGDTEFAEVPLDWNFNSKAIGFAVGFLQAFGVDIKATTRYDLASAAGKELDIFVENDTWQGRQINRVNHKYRPVKPEVTPVSRQQPA